MPGFRKGSISDLTPFDGVILVDRSTFFGFLSPISVTLW